MRVVGHPRGAVLGVAGPLIFLVGVILVSWSERDFMAELGWEHWPSGTALGPHGCATVLVFLLTGFCQIAFAFALLRQAGTSRVRRLGAGLLLVSGFGMAMLAFKTNHPDSDVNWHASIHVAAYFTFFLGLLLAYVLLTWGSWNRFDRSSWRHASLALVPWLGFRASGRPEAEQLHVLRGSLHAAADPGDSRLRHGWLAGRAVQKSNRVT